MLLVKEMVDAVGDKLSLITAGSSFLDFGIQSLDDQKDHKKEKKRNFAQKNNSIFYFCKTVQLYKCNCTNDSDDRVWIGEQKEQPPHKTHHKLSCITLNSFNCDSAMSCSEA